MRSLYQNNNNMLGTLNIVRNSDEAAAFVDYVMEHSGEALKSVHHDISENEIYVYVHGHLHRVLRFPFYVFESSIGISIHQTADDFEFYGYEREEIPEMMTINQDTLMSAKPTTWKIDLEVGTITNNTSDDILDIQDFHFIQIEVGPDGQSIVSAEYKLVGEA